MSTNVSEMMADLDGGTFEERLGRVISEVAGAVIDNGRAGEVNIKLSLKRISTSYQVQIDHKLSYKRPTPKGTVSEDTISSTPMYVGTGGKLSFFPENQSQMFGKKGEIKEHE